MAFFFPLLRSVFQPIFTMSAQQNDIKDVDAKQFQAFIDDYSTNAVRNCLCYQTTVAPLYFYEMFFVMHKNIQLYHNFCDIQKLFQKADC